MRHGEVSRGMFRQYPICAITNGVHAVSWTAPPLRELFDHHIPEWRYDNLYLVMGSEFSLEEIRKAHLFAKRTLFDEIASRQGIWFNTSPAL